PDVAIGSLTGVTNTGANAIVHSGASGAVSNGYFYVTAGHPEAPQTYDFLVTNAAGLPAPLPPAGALPLGFSDQAWSIAADKNSGNPYLLWQYPFIVPQGSGGSSPPANGGNPPAGGGNPGDPGGSPPSSAPPPASTFRQALEIAILQR